MWATPSEATGRSHHVNHRTRAFLRSSWRRSDRTSPYSIALPFCFVRPRPGRTSLPSIETPVQLIHASTTAPFVHLGTVAVDEGWISHLHWHGPYGTSPNSIAGSCCFVRSGPAADVAPGDRLADRADRCGGGAGVHDEGPTIPGAKWNTSCRTAWSAARVRHGNSARRSCPRFVHGAGPQQQIKGAVGDRVGNSARGGRGRPPRQPAHHARGRQKPVRVVPHVGTTNGPPPASRGECPLLSTGSLHPGSGRAACCPNVARAVPADGWDRRSRRSAPSSPSSAA